MKERNEQGPGAAAGASRRQRLAAALRDNLVKRKAQARARSSAAADAAGAADPEAPAPGSKARCPRDDDPSAGDR